MLPSKYRKLMKKGMLAPLVFFISITYEIASKVNRNARLVSSKPVPA